MSNKRRNRQSAEVLVGDCRQVLTTLPDESVQCVVTSPPYWGLRDYGMAGQLGLETDPAEYVANMVSIFREVRRVLRRDGTLWLNMGDCYATGAGKVGDHPGGGEQGARWKGYRGDHEGSPKHSIVGPMIQPNRMPIAGLKPKDLVGMPWRVAFALQADGWWLRSDIVWSKPNPMPESVQDRPTRAHEYLFLLSKSKTYHYDAAAIREPLKDSSLDRISQSTFDQQTGGPKDYATSGQNPNRSMRRTLENVRARAAYQRGHGRRHAGFNDRWDSMTREEQQAGGANKRTVWTVATRPYPDAHFATYPEALIEPCILAGCPEGGMVLDPFAGSGTTLAVALRLGRQAIGIELNPAYADLIHKRLAGVTLPLPLDEEAVS